MIPTWTLLSESSFSDRCAATRSVTGAFPDDLLLVTHPGPEDHNEDRNEKFRKKKMMGNLGNILCPSGVSLYDIESGLAPGSRALQA